MTSETLFATWCSSSSVGTQTMSLAKVFIVGNGGCSSWAMVNDNSNAWICERLDQFGEVSETVEGGLKFSGISGEIRSNWERERVLFNASGARMWAYGGCCCREASLSPACRSICKVGLCIGSMRPFYLYYKLSHLL